LTQSREKKEPRLLRINRLLSERGVASRRKAEELIRAGKVKVGREVVTDLSRQFPEDVRVVVDGKAYGVRSKKLYLFFKPRSVITTLSDPEGRRCVGDYTAQLPGRVYPVGRLDYDVSGLLLLTNDGDFAEHLMHPRYGVEREYLCRVKGEVSAETLAAAVRGVRDGKDLLKAKKVAIVMGNKQAARLLGDRKRGETVLRIVVTEGSKHFVKRLVTACGHQIIKLSRVRFGAFKLGDLQPGEIREVPIPKG
jgi:23S rRNA pseudouridine2605 synthase